MITIFNILIVAAGGAIGSAGRYVVTTLMRNALPNIGVVGTFTVNCLGSLLIGLISGWLISADLAEATRNTTRLLLVTGILGGFTTFSTFSLECADFAQQGNTTMAIAYPIISILTGIALAAIGLWLGSSISK